MALELHQPRLQSILKSNMAPRVLFLALLGLSLFTTAQSQTTSMTFGDINNVVYPYTLTLTAGSCLTETDALWTEWYNAVGGGFYSYNTTDPNAVIARYSNPDCSTAYVWDYAIGSVTQFSSDFLFASIEFLGDTAPPQPATTLPLFTGSASVSVLPSSSNVITTTSVASLPAISSDVPSGVVTEIPGAVSEVPSGTVSIPLVTPTGKSLSAASPTGRPSFHVIFALTGILAIMAFM